jgi:hypothetical protein
VDRRYPSGCDVLCAEAVASGSAPNQELFLNASAFTLSYLQVTSGLPNRCLRLILAISAMPYQKGEADPRGLRR